MRLLFCIAAAASVLCALMPQLSQGKSAAGPIGQADADAIVQKIILHESAYRNTYADPYPGRGNREFYVYEIVAKDPMPSSQHVDTLEINRRTGEVWVVRGVECFKHPLPSAGTPQAVSAAPGVDLPNECR